MCQECFSGAGSVFLFIFVIIYYEINKQQVLYALDQTTSVLFIYRNKNEKNVNHN